jgi:hypothetical protein
MTTRIGRRCWSLRTRPKGRLERSADFPRFRTGPGSGKRHGVRLAARPGSPSRSRLRPVVARSPVANPFESAWLKWAMAVTNARVLEDNIEVFASDQELKMHSRLATYYDARRQRVVLVVTEATDPFPVLWGVLLGEVAHDYRCCLDHLAWALYKRGRTPNLSERQERNVSFPIYGTREGSTGPWTQNSLGSGEQTGARPPLPALHARREPGLPARLHRSPGPVERGQASGDSASRPDHRANRVQQPPGPRAPYDGSFPEASAGSWSQAQSSCGSTSRRLARIHGSTGGLTSRCSPRSTSGSVWPSSSTER